MTQVSSIEPLEFTTLDGAERKFRLTMRNHKNLAEKFGASWLTMTVSAGLPHILYECLVDAEKEEGLLTEEQFMDLLPPDETLLLGFYEALKERFTPAVNERYRPVARPTGATTQLTNGSGS